LAKHGGDRTTRIKWTVFEQAYILYGNNKGRSDAWKLTGIIKTVK